MHTLYCGINFDIVNHVWYIRKIDEILCLFCNLNKEVCIVIIYVLMRFSCGTISGVNIVTWRMYGI